MNPLRLTLASILGLLAAADAETIFQDGFESGLSWAITSTNDGRARVVENEGAAEGIRHLLLDDAVDDSVFSVVEATISPDLTDRRNVVLTFMAKSVGNEPHLPPTENFTTARNYDGVALSIDGGTTWRTVQSLATVGPAWTAYTVPLDAAVTALGGAFGTGTRIRFSAYDNSAAPLDGIAIDQVSVTADFHPRVTVELPGTVAEGTGPHTGYVSLNAVQAQPVTVTLSSGSPALTVPLTVTVPAGDLSASFQVSAPDDNLVTLTRQVTVSASAPGFSSTPAVVAVLDNEEVQVELTLPPQVTEGGGSLTGRITITPAPAVSVEIPLSSAPAGQITLPSSASIFGGISSATFNVTATNDTRIDGDIPVTITAHVPGHAAVSGTVIAVDNETRALGLSVQSFVMEGGTGTATLSISGTLPEPLLVNLEATGGVLVPSSIFIPAGATQLGVPITVPDNATVEGTRTGDLKASASGFTPVTRTVTVRDNDAASFNIRLDNDLIPTGVPRNTLITARDMEGNVINNYTGSVDLAVELPGGSSLPVSPASVSLSSSGWLGAVTVPSTDATGLRLRVTGNGITSYSSVFDPIRTLDLQTADLLWNPLRGIIYASVPVSAGSPLAGRVVEIDPATMEVRRSVLTTQNPGLMALTSGGEYLYVAQDGNGRVAKIDPVTMTVISSFAVGIDPTRGTLYASDISTVAGSPDLLVVSRRTNINNPSHLGVAVYDNGVKREAEVLENAETVRIEPSGDPTKFWSQTSSAFRQLSLTANGITVAATNNSLGSSSSDIRAAGDRIYATTGTVIDGASMSSPGRLAGRGPVCPDGALNTVYFVEASSGLYTQITSYNASTFALVRRVTMPSVGTTAGSLIRWGNHGLAFRSATKVHVVGNPSLVPGSAPADLAVSVTASPLPAAPSDTLTYTVNVDNLGPNTARGGVLSVTLSPGQTVRMTSATSGTPTVTGSQVTLPLPDMPDAARQTLTLTVNGLSAGTLHCSARVTSDMADPDFRNNHSGRLVNVGYQTGPDATNVMRVTPYALVEDPTRNVLWAVLPEGNGTPFEDALISIDGLTGTVSEPVFLGFSPQRNSAALSANGRYLYLGLAGRTSVLRIDLSPARPLVERIDLPPDPNFPNLHAVDIEVLAGDGTSILVADSVGRLQVIDGTTPRSPRSVTLAQRIAPTVTPGVYFAQRIGLSSTASSQVRVTATGVELIRTQDSLITDRAPFTLSGIEGEGDRVLSNLGHLVDSTGMTLIATLPAMGGGCVDAENRRAYINTGGLVRAFDADTGAAVGSRTIPTSFNSLLCVRWGNDGIATTTTDGNLHLLRWPLVDAGEPSDADTNGDGIPDGWAMQHFGAITIPPGRDWDGDGIPDVLEYLFAGSPVRAGASPLGSSVVTEGTSRTLVLRFQRRTGVAAGSYRLETSGDLGEWAAAPTGSETVLSTGTVDGVAVEYVEARIPMAGTGRGFARIKWLKP